jgi:hypothetical protein
LPNQTYSLVLDLNLGEGLLGGEETVKVHNPLPQDLDKIIFTLDLNLMGPAWGIDVKSVKDESGAEVKFANPTFEGKVDRSLMAVSLAKGLQPNADQELRIDFAGKFPRQVDGAPVLLDDSFYASSSYYPRVIGYLEEDLKASRFRDLSSASYRAQVTTDADQIIASTGRTSKEETSGGRRTVYLESNGTRGFGLVLSPKFSVKSEVVQGVSVKAFSLPGGEERQAKLLEAAGDVLRFYAKDVGFYPGEDLAILPGSESFGGGTASSNMILIHKHEVKGHRNYFDWIVAHEVAHQYWGAYVGDPNDYPKWLTLGLTQWLDERYERSKDKELRRRPWEQYLVGIALGVDTTIMQPIEKLEASNFDWNSIIAHSKSYAVIKMLENVIGPFAFERVVAALLERYGGRIVTPKDMIRTCERVSEQKLGWFFDQWLYTNKKLDFKITDQVEGEVEGTHMLRLKIKRLGDAKMPMRMKVFYKDGSQQIDQIKEDTVEAEVIFTSKSTMERVVLDPDEVLPLKNRMDELRPDVIGRALFKTGRYAEAAEKLRDAVRGAPSDAEAHFILGLCLYDGRDYAGAIGAFQRASDLSDADAGLTRKAWSQIWIGHIQDIEGRREEAIASYRKAIALNCRERATFDQYGIDSDAVSWASERIRTPYVRK